MKRKNLLTYKDLFTYKDLSRASYLLLICASLLLYPSILRALTFKIPFNGNIVGEMQVAKVREGESLGDIGRRFDLGVYEMIEANPNLNPWDPVVGADVIIPTKFILPSPPYKGLVINLAEMRIYYFHPNNNLITTFPIGIGKKGWQTPLGQGRIIDKQVKPTWYPPDSIREAHALDGDILPASIPPGPDNPLGEYALRLSIPGYMIHGTNRMGGIGVRSSSGCIRLFPEDIEALFYQVSLQDPVRIIHSPYKFGLLGKQIFLEAHQPLSDANYYKANYSVAEIKHSLQTAIQHNVEIDWSYALRAIDQARGFPVLIPQI